ncbi:MAG: aminodeoxychorismate synthase component I [Kiritimatiellia bacterium]|jgi:para-aminobenzoate synthetase/4-amino-4-deoxychorismate lyase|nr:aminodeoxychorismate synthase component I [Kiritimatiellia bacterium]MDP6630598.1 aminodeoxychorismate synthase component I [Kiritimatiellia bacterium]MDP6811303.1 aminodeoxychorismate synthase component I [Kiritimatiellia bacterium]MDP7024609.1 aminodeoxychorismate synthase component I [Kiritimatiellia bacterium]
MAPQGQPSVNSVVLQDPWRRRWIRYSDPERLLVARTIEEVLPVLEAAEAAVEAEGLTAAGFVAYEAAAACDPALVTHPPTTFPLAWFGLYAQGDPIEPPQAGDDTTAPRQWTPSLDDDTYHAAIARVRDYIAAGDTYQVNFSFRLNAPAPADAWSLFCRMAGGSPAGYAAYVDTGDWALCSASPELFFRLSGRDIVSRPMKGTRPRGRWPGEDAARAQELQQAAKDRAENVMIVDMVRNDLGRIADPGSVDVAKLFDVERYPTVLQMTSTVHGQTDAGLADIFRALFPAASITGAPKAHTMEIITELEESPRRIYTGTIGYLAPGRDAQFNVAIRSALVDRTRESAEYGVGGGIVWDSCESAELAECYTKAAVLRTPTPPFELLESFLWVPGTGYFLPEQHGARLQASADYFGWRIDRDAIRKALAAESDPLADEAHKVRLAVGPDGHVTVTSAPLLPLADPYRVCLAGQAVDAEDRFLFHKTTHRKVYKEAREAHPDADDVLLWNADGELTESTIANLVVELDGNLVTPPVRCGLLAGVYREFLLAGGAVREAVVHRDDLARCTRVCLVNSVRGMWDVSIEY